MNFYQQKYFKPYHKIVSDHHPLRRHHDSESSSSPQKYRQSPTRDQLLSSGFQRSPFKHVQAEHIVQPVWEHLYNKGMQSQKDLLQRHNKRKNRLDTQCTFQPILRHNKRYLAASSSNFLERVTIWQEHKLEKMIREKQEGVNKDLKECTFAPVIKELPSKSRNEPIENMQNKSQIKFPAKNRNLNPYYSPIKTTKQKYRLDISPAKKTPQKVELNYAKNAIRSELKRIII